MSAERAELDTGAWTVDELAAELGSTVRTIRYYATLGLIPAPERRGRMAYYDDRHRSRLELIRALQEQGLSLTAIEQHLARFTQDTAAEEIDLSRTIATSWAPVPPFRGDRAALDARAGRSLTDAQIAWMGRLGILEENDGEYVAGPTLDVGIGLLDLDVPAASVEAANLRIRHHMDALALELQDIMAEQVIPGLRESGRIDDASVHQTMTRLRQLTLDSVAANFQRAMGGLVDGSLIERAKETTQKEH